MQKLGDKVSSLVQNFPISGHNWKLDMDRAPEKYFLDIFFSGGCPMFVLTIGPVCRADVVWD